MKHRGFFYLFFRPLVKFALFIFYRKIEISGNENLPRGQSYILAPNHQNAFMDALVISCFTKKPIHFLVRADVFKNKIAARVFKSFNMLPIYRERDGRHNMHKNEVIFEKCNDLLNHGEVLMIFPEASHFGKRFLRPLRKGIARIGFDSVERHSHLSELKIIPIGINYTDYFNSHSDLFINIGKPLLVKQYYQILEENKLMATTAILDDLHTRIRAELLHIESEKVHTIIEKLYLNFIFYFKNSYPFGNTPKENYNYFKNKFVPRFYAKENDRKIETIDHYFLAVEKYKIYYPFHYLLNFSLAKKIAIALLLFVLFPLYIITSASVILPIFLINNQIKNKVKDRQFISSFKITAGIFLFALSGILNTIILFELFGNFFLSSIYFLCYPMLYIFYTFYRRIFKLAKSIYFFSKINYSKVEELKKLESEVINILEIK